ncbi:MAG: FkbM family methyltransferase [Candidatus Bipolaricaulota bacterium]|nr:FkbM family methyltransferase [Candidatus Bipolaricaulota bacterium]MDW8127543.1 FkbM family methyltransferase [Candidatus Bipolaricaulota bacterium]
MLLDSEGGLGLYRVGEREIYFPLEFDPAFLGFIYDEVFVRRVYEHGECQVRPGDWVVDAGACEGLFSLYALEKGANVLAFEPVPQLVHALEKNLDPFVRAGRAQIYPLALGRQKEEKTIHIFRSNVAGSTLSEEALRTREEGPSSSFVVLVAPLDSLLSSLPPVSFLKADVEGYERELLIGARETLRRFRPRLSICTYHRPDDPLMIRKLIKDSWPFYRIKFKGVLTHLCAWAGERRAFGKGDVNAGARSRLGLNSRARP